MPDGDLVARVKVHEGDKSQIPKPIFEVALEIQREILLAASKCVAITRLGSVPARVVDFELFRGPGGIDSIVLHYEDPTRPSGKVNYFTKTLGIPHFYTIPNGGNPQ